MYKDSTRYVGRTYEEVAKRYLINQGYLFVTQNFSSPIGEIDLIFTDSEYTVFVEVKARKNKQFGNPELAVNKKKLHRINRTAEYFLQKYPHLPQLGRVDIVAIIFSPGKEEIKHIKAVY